MNCRHGEHCIDESNFFPISLFARMWTEHSNISPAKGFQRMATDETVLDLELVSCIFLSVVSLPLGWPWEAQSSPRVAQTRSQRYRKIRKHVARMWRGWDSNPGQQASLVAQTGWEDPLGRSHHQFLAPEHPSSL